MVWSSVFYSYSKLTSISMYVLGTISIGRMENHEDSKAVLYSVYILSLDTAIQSFLIGVIAHG